MALILVDMIAKQILRELGVDKVLLSLATSKIFFSCSSHWLPTMQSVTCSKVILSVVLVIPSPVYALSPFSLTFRALGTDD
jgi:hypothetical protein